MIRGFVRNNDYGKNGISLREIYRLGKFLGYIVYLKDDVLIVFLTSNVISNFLHAKASIHHHHHHHTEKFTLEVFHTVRAC